MNPFTRKHRMSPEEAARAAELRAVEKRVEIVTERALNAADALEQRRRRNHWGDTVAAIARGRHV